MTFYNRDQEKTLQAFSKFPVVAVLGPRQSGKTTLVRHIFPNHVYLNLDDLELLQMIMLDPKGVLRKYDNDYGIIIDEFQNAPELLSYIKIIVDTYDRSAYFILTGSHNFLMNQSINQSLAGRVGILTLLPLSLHELFGSELITKNHPESPIVCGGYPRLYAKKFTPSEFYPSYIRTYIERDVRQLINVVNVYAFQKLIKLCAARIGQLVNYSDLATHCGISVPTVHQWLSLLETSYIIFLLRPHWNNFSKRIIKTPKLYFFDTGLACSLLDITSEKSLLLHPLYGYLFENMIIADFVKQYYNQGLMPSLYFWRDKNGDIEVDCLVSQESRLIPIEIKSAETYHAHFLRSLIAWNTIAHQENNPFYIVYGGSLSLARPEGKLIPWHEAGTLMMQL